MELWSALVRTELATNTMPDAWHSLLATSTRVNAGRAVKMNDKEESIIAEHNSTCESRHSRA
jgi:hypothetical protein